MIINNWYIAYRMQWIDEMLLIYGFINREHLIKKFNISVPQASKDLNFYMKHWPNRMKYNLNTKRYEIVNK
jgi:hypothetical protein